MILIMISYLYIISWRCESPITIILEVRILSIDASLGVSSGQYTVSPRGIVEKLTVTVEEIVRGRDVSCVL